MKHAKKNKRGIKNWLAWEWDKIIMWVMVVIFVTTVIVRFA